MNERALTAVDAAVDVEGLRKVYTSRRRGDTVAVDDVSFSLRPGEIVGLLGPNGAGKTTTIKCICTLVKPSVGRVHVHGVDAIAHRHRALDHVTAVLEGNRNVWWRLTPVENLELFAGLQGISIRRVRTTIDGLLERFDLGSKRDTPARMLSKGMQQKLALACAVVKGTPVLLLDEPTLGLDVEASHELRGLIRELASTERTILLSSHDMSVVQDLCQRVIIVNAGRVVTDDSVSNLLALFRARAYRFTLADPLPPAHRSELERAFPLASVDGTTIDVELEDAGGFYTLVDALRGAAAVIESVDRRDPDLEEVFLRIVRTQR